MEACIPLGGAADDELAGGRSPPPPQASTSEPRGWRRRGRRRGAGRGRRRRAVRAADAPGALPPVAAPPPPARRAAAPGGRRDKRPRAYDDDDDEEEDAGSKKPKRVEGAATPGEIERALTFKGATIAWAILKRKKVLENRPYRLPCGGWIAIHVGKGAFEGDYRGLVTDCRLPTEEELMRSWQATIVGAFRVKECRRPQNCGGSFWAQGPVCNVVDAVIELKEPVSAPKGKLSLWLMDDDVRDAVAAGLKDAPVLTNDLGALPPYEPILGPITPGRNKRREMGNVEHVFARRLLRRAPRRPLRRRRLPGAYAAYHDALPPPYYAPRAYSPPFPPHAPPYGGAPAAARRRPRDQRRATAPRRAPAPPPPRPPAALRRAAAGRLRPYRATRNTWPGYDPRGAFDRGADLAATCRGPLEASREWLYRSHYPPHHDRGDDARRDAPPLYDARAPPPYPHPPRYDPGPPPP
ncbi:hypothetical protein JL720_14401 [Aureococcus anophagefferens]|nr:hypothetical protein JL720_14401 [Aureococcus anophagefferens]